MNLGISEAIEEQIRSTEARLIDSKYSFRAFPRVDIDLVSVLTGCADQFIIVIVLFLGALLAIFSVFAEVRSCCWTHGGFLELFAFCHKGYQSADAVISANNPLFVVQIGVVIQFFDAFANYLIVLV